MPIYALGDKAPRIDERAFVHPDAVVIGDVRIGADSSIWPGAVLRGDDGYIEIGERTSIQDNCVIHTTPDHPTVVGNDCVIGHIVHLEACTIEDRAQVSSGAVVLHRVVVGTGAIVAANAVVLNDMYVPPGALAVGTPATIKEGRARSADIEYGAAVYVHKGRRFAAELRRLPDHERRID
jgi:carbonic anhydrase/acetyltransferase-like protein (isoleucine patch superfamily)